jgi:hypothetical protein
MVIQHRLYGYKGLIYGWDPSCRKSKRWIEESSVDRLEHGKFRGSLGSDLPNLSCSLSIFELDAEESSQ